MLDQDGRPVAGARVHVVSILRYPTPLLTRYLEQIRNAVIEGGEDLASIINERLLKQLVTLHDR